jgi:hypothetical protein
VPGGIVVVLAEIAMRVYRDSVSSAAFVNDVGLAIFIAFGSGIVLYFVDIAYSTPQFWRGIPSQHLETRAVENGIPPKVAKDKALGIFFVMLEEHAPRLHDKALLYGAFYRIGFQLVFFSIVTIVLTPVGLLTRDILLHGDAYGQADPTRLAWLAVALLVLFVVAALRTFRPTAGQQESGSRPRIRLPLSLGNLLPKGVRSLVVAIATLGSGSWALGWAFVVGGRRALFVDIPQQPTLGRWLIALATTGSLALWAFVRLVGPVKQWWKYVNTPDGRKPDRPHTGSQIDSLDSAVVLGPITALYLTGSHLSVSQIAVLSSMTAIVLWLGHIRKYERANSGLYRNQRDWIDRNLDSLLQEFPLTATESPEESPSSTETGTPPAPDSD